MGIETYLYNILYGVDRLANTVADNPRQETISATLGRRAATGKWGGRFFAGMVDMFAGAGHCNSAYVSAITLDAADKNAKG